MKQNILLGSGNGSWYLASSQIFSTTRAAVLGTSFVYQHIASTLGVFGLEQCRTLLLGPV